MQAEQGCFLNDPDLGSNWLKPVALFRHRSRSHHSGVTPAFLHKVARPPALLHAPLIHRAVHASGNECGVVRGPPQAAHL